ncbi:hypothetical protein C0991_009717 [Blastosporella zonata]|nr:hypothetical protein C0991_009717 [Blastosporella zonata]
MTPEYALPSLGSFFRDASKVAKPPWNGERLETSSEFELDSLVQRAVTRSAAQFWTAQAEPDITPPNNDSPLPSPASPPTACVPLPAVTRAPSDLSTPPVDIGTQAKPKNRAKRRSREKRKASRAKSVLEADRTQFGTYQVPKASLSKHRGLSKPLASRFDVSTSKVASSSFVGARRKFDLEKKLWSLEELQLATGFPVHSWDGHTPTPIHDSKGRIFALCGGQPAAPGSADWDADLAHAAELLEEARRNLRLPPGSRDHRRGSFTAVPSGITHGNGTTRPCNAHHSPHNAQVINHLSQTLFAAWFPGQYEYYNACLGALFAQDTQLRRNYSNSVFPAATYNVGPSTVCCLHIDDANLPFGICAITALGNYDPKLGGHIVLWDCGLIIEFPPGSTILIPSAVVAHMNVAVRPGETRYSFTQYAAGGLFRWVEHGFQKDGSFFSQLDDEALAVQKELETRRWAGGVDMFSKLSDLVGATK